MKIVKMESFAPILTVNDAYLVRPLIVNQPVIKHLAQKTGQNVDLV
jgi:hypothetical protein